MDGQNRPVSEILVGVTSRYLSYLEGEGIDPGFEQGVIAAMLEIETRVRLFEAIEGTSLISFNRFEVASALRDVQRSLLTSQISIESLYDELIQRAECVAKRGLVYDEAVVVDEAVALAPAQSDPQTQATHLHRRAGRMTEAERLARRVRLRESSVKGGWPDCEEYIARECRTVDRDRLDESGADKG